MARIAAPITMSEAQRAELEMMERSHKIELRYAKRAQVLLLRSRAYARWHHRPHGAVPACSEQVAKSFPDIRYRRIEGCSALRTAKQDQSRTANAGCAIGL